MTCVFKLSASGWLAMWRGEVAKCDFNSRGAALAWIAVCEKARRFRS